MKCFPSTLRWKKFENSTIRGPFGVVFKEHSTRKVTWLSTGSPDDKYDQYVT